MYTILVGQQPTCLSTKTHSGPGTHWLESEFAMEPLLQLSCVCYPESMQSRLLRSAVIMA